MFTPMASDGPRLPSRDSPRGLPGTVKTFPPDFQPANAPNSGAVTTTSAVADLKSERDRIYEKNQNLFLTHIWRPSQREMQKADISIRLEEHPKRHGPLKDVKPLSQGLVEKVEYNLGTSWFGGKSVVKTNAKDDFRLDISAYGSALCLAHVYLRDGRILTLERYLDFADASRGGAEPSRR
jgi:prokaryotic YEATS domain